MSEADREDWDARYQERGDAPDEPSAFLVSLGALVPTRGRALDVAGGSGRHAIWLARRGLETTLADISPVALAFAREAATAAGVSINTCALDLDENPLPPGPWE
jgi:methylase of polypeptide subunit release factors